MERRIEGFDYLRALLSVFVVAWHMSAAGKSLIFSQERYLEHTFTLSDLVNFHILMLAVPGFIFISSFLYARKGVSLGALKKRMLRLLPLVTFWPVAIIVYRHGFKKLLHLVPRSPEHFLLLVMRAGYTPYYFFVSLMAALLFTHLIAKLGTRSLVAGFALSILYLAVIPTVTEATGLYLFSAYYNPLNFVAICFAAVLVARNLEALLVRMKGVVGICLVLTLLFAVFEWYFCIGESAIFRSQNSALPTYTRASLTFTVVAISLLALQPKIRSGAVIRFMSKYALAVYCLHLFLMRPTKLLLLRHAPDLAQMKMVHVPVVILSCYGLAVLLRYYLKDRVLV